MNNKLELIAQIDKEDFEILCKKYEGLTEQESLDLTESPYMQAWLKAHVKINPDIKLVGLTADDK